MQLLSRKIDGTLVLAKNAQKQHPYECLECKGVVRLRGGLHRQLHFYHLEPPLSCRQHQKGMVHLQTQLHFQSLLGEDCLLEHQMPEINRIADVAWLSKKIVFEIQFSPISAQEVKERNQDYIKLGWQVVWILHDRRYNQSRHSSAELFLRTSPHYYTNIDEAGHGFIYDQFDSLYKGWRQHQLTELPINVQNLRTMEPAPSKIQLLKMRSQLWPIYFGGDLVDLAHTQSNPEYLQQALEREKLIAIEKRKERPSLISFYNTLSGFYKFFFHHLLEKMCR